MLKIFVKLLLVSIVIAVFVLPGESLGSVCPDWLLIPRGGAARPR
ncbi:hypothetical protein [Bradyrhizobium canariense]|nr:hypothetical protein [Bradyrhizobium canariense]